ncbi:MAG: sugar ABC transporter permease [Anaerolineales bacterium]|nr:sugar ABC transporter permease [Anaerolineales bacterium]
MAVSARPASPGTPLSASSRTGLGVLTAWQAGLGLALAGAAGAAAAGLWLADLDPLLRWGAAVLLAVGALASGYAAWAVAQRRAAGRIAVVLVNYLVAVLAGLLALNSLGVFVGIDALAGTFANGLPWLGVVFLGYLIGTAGDRFEGTARERLPRQIGRWVMLAGGLVFLYAVEALAGLLWFGAQLIAQPGAAGLLALTAVSGGMVALGWSRPTAEALSAGHMQEELLNGYLFLSPNLLGFLIFFAGPLALSLYISTTTTRGAEKDIFVGLDNYARIFNVTVQPLADPDQPAREVVDVARYTEAFRVSAGGGTWLVAAQEPRFWIALRNTIIFVILAVPLSVIPALLLATILNSKLPGMSFYRAVYFIPSIAAVVGIALVWRWMYDSTTGWINYFITLAVEAGRGLGLAAADPRIQWLNDTNTALLAVAIMAVWQTMGFNSVLFLAGLQNVPGELYEAATVDGAGNFQRFWSITLPLLAPTTFFVVSTTTIQALQVFEQVYILTNPPGSPSDATLTLVLYLYQEGFNRFDFGFAAAVAWVLFAVIFLFTLAQFQRNRQSSLYEG